MDKIDSVNDSHEMFLRNDTPGCVRHEKGDTFSEIYLSYLSGPKGVRDSVERVLRAVPAGPEVRLSPRHAQARPSTSSGPITCAIRRPARTARGWPG